MLKIEKKETFVVLYEQSKTIITCLKSWDILLKNKQIFMTDSRKYREGRVKSTLKQGGEKESKMQN